MICECGSMRMGDPIRTELILTGWDSVAIDVVTAKIMGFSTGAVPYLSKRKKDDKRYRNRRRFFRK